MSETAKRLEVRQEVIGYRLITKQPGASDDTIVVLDEHGEPQTYVHSRPKQTIEAAPTGQEYVDSYLFETGYFSSREEYEELSRTARIIPRARA